MLMRGLVLVLFAMPSITAIASESDKYSVVDLDVDGQPDVVQLRVKSETVLLAIKMNSRQLPVIEIPIDGSKQFGICAGSKPRMKIEQQSEAPLNALGEWPHGYTACPKCIEIQIGDGDCDPIHFYWDKVDAKIAWWRE